MGDILTEEVHWVEGRPYLVPHVVYPSVGEDEEEQGNSSRLYEEVGFSFQESEDGIAYDDGPICQQQEDGEIKGHSPKLLPEVKADEKGGWICDFPVASAFFKFVIGRNGDTKRKLEMESNCSILVPRMGQEGNVLISGRTRKAVESGRNKVSMTIDSARQRHDFTHFLTIPFNTRDIRNEFDVFKRKVEEVAGSARGFDDSIFQATPRLHLTLGMMVLLSEAERKSAIQILQGCIDQDVKPLLGSQMIRLDLRGLEYMNDDPGEVDVLYAQVYCEQMGLFRRIIHRVTERMRESGYMTTKEDLKLHVTLINTRYRRDITGAELDELSSGREKRKRETFDARLILENFRDYDIGSVCFDSVCICQLYSSSINRPANAEYLVSGTAKF